jgi:hypothetical protein
MRRGIPLALVGLTACGLVLGISDPTLETGPPDARPADAAFAVDAGIDAAADAAATGPDAMLDAAQPAPTHSGEIWVNDVTLVNGVTGNPDTRVGNLIRAELYALPGTHPPCDGTGTAPCQVGVTPVGGCLTTLLSVGQPRPPQTSAGTLTIQSAGQSSGGEPATSAIGPCDVQGPDSFCAQRAGSDGAMAANGTFTDAQAAFAADDVGRWLVTVQGFNRTPHAIGAFHSSTSIGVANGDGDFVASTWMVVDGLGFNPNSRHILNERDSLQFSYPGSSAFEPITQASVPIGDNFSFTAETATLLSQLDNEQDIVATAAPLVFACDSCGTAAGGPVLYLQLSATAGPARLLTRCAAIGQTSVTLPDAHWALYQSRAASLDHFRIELAREGVVQVVNQHPRAKNTVTLFAGHGYVLETSPVPATD